MPLSSSTQTAGNGSQRLIGGPNTVELWDDFTKGLFSATWTNTEGTDGATSNAYVWGGGTGGILRLTTGDAGTGYAADAEQITQPTTDWVAQNGGLTFEARIRLSAITTCYAFLGFTDTAAVLEQPIRSGGNADIMTTVATNAVGIMFDTGMVTDTWWATGVADNVDAAHESLGLAPVGGIYETFRIEVSATGDAVFYRNGARIGSDMAGAVAPTKQLTPVLTVSKLSVAESMNMDIDYVHVTMTRE